MISLPRLLLITLTAVCFATSGQLRAGGIRYLTNPGKMFQDVGNRIGDGRQGLILSNVKEAESYFQVESKPFIDANGNVYSGTRHSGQTPAYLGKAQKRQINGSVYWVWKSLRRRIGSAPQYQQQQNVARQREIERQRQIQTQQQQQRWRQQQMFQQNLIRQQQLNQQYYNTMQQSINNINNAFQQLQYRR